MLSSSSVEESNDFYHGGNIDWVITCIQDPMMMSMIMIISNPYQDSDFVWIWKVLCVKRLMIIMISWIIWTKSFEICFSIDQKKLIWSFFFCFSYKRKITDWHIQQTVILDKYISLLTTIFSFFLISLQDAYPVERMFEQTVYPRH